jgi:putative endonuclease
MTNGATICRLMSISLPAARHGTLYLGVTNDLMRRIQEHKSHDRRGFAARYGVDRLVWFEAYDDPRDAIAREKGLKKWRRDWKIRLSKDKTRSGVISTPRF